MKPASNVKPFTIDDIQQISSRIIHRDREYLSSLMQEMGRVQPFFTSGMMEAVTGFEPGATDEVLTLYLVVWGVYRQHAACHETAVIRGQFERLLQRNISLFRYLDREDDTGLFGEVVDDDFRRLHHGALLQYVSHCLQTFPGLSRLDLNDYFTTLVGLKSFIECFEELLD